MVGGKYINQIKILRQVDLVITHGGNTTQNEVIYNSNYSSIQLNSLNEEDVLIYPNPASSEVWINIGLRNQSKFFELKIFSSIGRNVYSKIIDSAIPKSNLNLSPGVYFYQIGFDNETQTGKLLIQ